MRLRSLVLLILILLSPLVSGSQTFQNDYLSFDLDKDWTCQKLRSDWTCQPNNPAISKSALILVSAKYAGPEDRWEKLVEELKNPRPLTLPSGITRPSEVIRFQQTPIKGQTWIYALHLGSEIPNFYSLYLSTIKENLVILVSLSAEKSQSTRFNKTFNQVVSSLNITAPDELLRLPKAPAPSPMTSTSTEPDTKPSRLPTALLLLGLAAFVGLFALYLGNKR